MLADKVAHAVGIGVACAGKVDGKGKRAREQARTVALAGNALSGDCSGMPKQRVCMKTHRGGSRCSLANKANSHWFTIFGGKLKCAQDPSLVAASQAAFKRK